MRAMPLRKQWWLTIGAVLLVGGPLLSVPALAVWLPTRWIVAAGHRHVRPMGELPRCQAAIVLGAGVRPSGTPSATLADRLDTGIDLYRAGRVRKLLLSGDHGQHTYDEANAMRRYALAAGVPASDVFLDHAGFSTYETMYRARDVFQVRTAIVVTQRFHLDRAVYTARALGLEAWGCEADRRRYALAFRNELREVLARAKAILWLHLLEPKPRYLGPAIPITGDGRATWDRED
jgi:SanA protein